MWNSASAVAAPSDLNFSTSLVTRSDPETVREVAGSSGVGRDTESTDDSDFEVMSKAWAVNDGGTDRGEAVEPTGDQTDDCDLTARTHCSLP